MALDERARPEGQPNNLARIAPPRQRGDVLSRQRLLDFLTEHLDRKLILVCAAAGYGKTTLLADFAHRARVPVCWYSLTAQDADPRVFLEYLVGAIQRRFPGFGERTLGYLRAAGAKDVDVVVGLLLGELHNLTDQPFAIIFDDVHAVDEHLPIQNLLNRLILDLPSNCCCVLASRSVPRVRVSRLVANREAAGLGDADLRFTTAEIHQLFTRHYKIVVPEAMIEEIAREAEGWIAGIILTSHVLWQGLFKGWIQSQRNQGPLFDYLAAEVFDNQPAERQNFLLATSVLTRLTPPRCAALSGETDSAEILRGLDRENLFIASLEENEEAYRYHALFQEFLQTRLRRTDPERYQALQRQAGELAEAEGEEGIALDHYLQAKDFCRAAALVERAAGVALSQGRVHSVLQWCSQLPEAAFVGRPHLLTALAHAAFECGDMDQAWRMIERAYAESHQLNDQKAIATVLIERIAMLRYRGELAEAVADGKTGLAIAERIGAIDLVANGYRQLGTSLTAKGDLTGAVEALERSLAHYVVLDDHYNQGVVCHTLGIVWKRLGDMAHARGSLDQALRHWREIGNQGMLAGSLVVQGNLHYELGQLDSALQVLNEARAAANQSGYLRLNGYATESLGDVYRDHGEFASAQTHYEEGLVLAEQVGDRFLQIAALEGLARCQRYAGESGLARATILRARHLASERESAFERGLCEDTYGALCLDAGQVDQARSVLSHACDLLKSAGVRDRARARLHYAQALLQAGESADAIVTAVEALRDLPAGAQEPLLVIEAGYLADLLQAVGRAGPPWLSEVGARPGLALNRRVGPREVVFSPAGQHRIECFTLGRADLVVDARPLGPADWPTQKARELWFYLLTQGPVSRDQIVEALWPEADIDPSAFHTTVHRLRRALFAESVERQGSLWRVGHALALVSDDRIFEEQALQARQLLQAEASEPNLDRASHAITLYRGRYLEGLDADWVLPTRRRLEGLYLRLLRDLVDRLRTVKRHADAIAAADLFLQTSPDDEAIHEALLRSYVALGNRAAALRHYQSYAQQLRDELSTEPSRRLRFLYEQLSKDN